MSSYEMKEKSMVDMFVTIEGDEWKDAVSKAFDRLAKNVEIDGFRKGQAPKSLIEKHVPAANRYMEAVDHNANHWLLQGLEENELNPISQPRLDIKDVNDDKVELVYTFAITPETKVTDYKGLDYKVEEATATDEEINDEVERMRNQYAELEVTDKKSKDGDTVNIDYEGFKDGEPFDGGKADGYDLELGSGQFIPGFEEQLVGKGAGEEVEVNVKFPEEYHAEELKGAAALFKVKVNEVKKKVVPDLDDEFAKDLNIKDVESLDDLKKTIKERIENSKKASAEQDAENSLLEQLLERIEVDLPEVLVEDEVNAQIGQMAQQIQAYGMQFEQYLGMMGKTLDDLKKDYSENAEKTVKIRLALQKISELEDLKPTEEEIEAQLKEIADMYQMELDQVKSMISNDMISQDVANQKALTFLKENAKK